MDIIIGLAVIAGLGYGAYWLVERYRPKTFCPECGDEMEADTTKYRYTVEWTCMTCGETYEQLRNGN